MLRAAAFRLDRTAATDTALARQALRASGDVRVWSRAYAATGDSLFSLRTGPEGQETDSVRFVRLDSTASQARPIGFLRRAQVSADTLVLVAEGGEARRLHAVGAAFVAEQDSTTGRFQQAKGDRLDGTFSEGNRRRFVIGPRAELLFFRSAEGRPDGAVRASGDRAVLESVGDSLRALDVYEGVEGKYVPENLNAAGERLDGFDWQPTRRPTFDALTRGYTLPRLERPPSRLVAPGTRQAVLPVEAASVEMVCGDQSPFRLRLDLPVLRAPPPGTGSTDGGWRPAWSRQEGATPRRTLGPWKRPRLVPSIRLTRPMRSVCMSRLPCPCPRGRCCVPRGW